MSEQRPFCIWVTPEQGHRGSASYALPPRYKTLAAAQKAVERDWPTGRTVLGASVRAGDENGGPA